MINLLRKGDKGQRDTEQVIKMVRMLANKWAQFMVYYDQMGEDEQTYIFQHFASLDENLGDLLFGGKSTAEDIKRYVLSRPDAEKEAFVNAMDEALEQKLWEM